MDIKLTQSKINLLEAKIRQFNDCGYFSDEEIARLTKPVKEELGVLYGKLNGCPPEDMEVQGITIVS